MATVKLFGNLHQHAKAKRLTVSGSTVRAIVEVLCTGSPPMCDVLLENGQLRPHFKIMLNGHDITLIQGMETPVEEHDQIAIFPPVAGG
jgi:molybdopterin synthase sulfur carrier subunit